MNTYNYSIDEEVVILEKYLLTPNELDIIKSLLLMQEGYEENYLIKIMYVLKANKIELRDILKSLQDKGIILKTYNIPMKGQAFDPMEIQVNKNFVKTIWKASFELGKELFEVYPQFANINGCVVPLRTVAKKFNSLEDAYRFYGKQIRWNKETHEHILDLVKWASDKNVINMSLCSFLVNNSWNDLQALKEGKITNVNYDTIKLI